MSVLPIFSLSGFQLLPDRSNPWRAVFRRAKVAGWKAYADPPKEAMMVAEESFMIRYKEEEQEKDFLEGSVTVGMKARIAAAMMDKTCRGGVRRRRAGRTDVCASRNMRAETTS